MAEEARQTGVLRLYVMYEPLDERARFRMPYRHCQHSYVVREGGFTPEQMAEFGDIVPAFIEMLVGSNAE